MKNDKLRSLSNEELHLKISSSPVTARDALRIGLPCMGLGLFYQLLDYAGNRLSPGNSCAHATMVYTAIGIVLMVTFIQISATNARLDALTELLKRKDAPRQDQ